MVDQLIVNKILEVQKRKESIIVAFCGAADLGKTYLANKVVGLLNNIHTKSSHLPLDSFLMDRAERKRMDISGYDIRAHNTKQILSSLEKWVQGEAIKFQPYNHQSGQKSKHYKIIKRCNVLLIEGLFSLEDSMLPLIDLSFFIDTDYEKLKAIKLEADLVKRGYSPEYSQKIYDKEFKLYKRNIEPFKAKADFRLLLKNKWQYELEEK